MKKKNQKSFWIAVCLLAVFVLWTLLVACVDVREIGPDGSAVGFATLNSAVRELMGVNMRLYTATDWLGLVPIATALGFAVLGLVQWVTRKRFLSVDHSILALGVFYVVVIAVYVFFELVVINYRPVLISGYAEASYPSSTTVLASCVMPTAAIQLNARIKIRRLRRCVTMIIAAFVAFMVIGRFLSGVHWITDIIGGLLLSAGLVMLYSALITDA